MTLLGDAAHPMVPHLGQGAAQAIEDAFTLAVFLEGAKRQDVPRQLKAYERLRLERTAQIQTIARETGRFFRAEYQDIAERDLLMAKWMAATGWIRGHDAEKTAKEALLLPGSDKALDKARACAVAQSTPSAQDRSLALPALHRIDDLAGKQRVELTRSLDRPAMTAIGAKRTAGVDGKGG
jgi:FAD binding domain